MLPPPLPGENMPPADALRECCACACCDEAGGYGETIAPPLPPPIAALVEREAALRTVVAAERAYGDAEELLLPLPGPICCSC